VLRELYGKDDAVWSKAAHLIVAGKQREEKKLGSQDPFQGHTINVLLLPIRPHLLRFPSPPNSSLNYESINELTQ
jgi:hypothetical protein